MILTTMNYPAQGVQEAKHQKVLQDQSGLNIEIPPKNKMKLQVDTHAQEQMFPPIMIVKAEVCLFRFQP